MQTNHSQYKHGLRNTQAYRVHANMLEDAGIKTTHRIKITAVKAFRAEALLLKINAGSINAV